MNLSEWPQRLTLTTFKLSLALYWVDPDRLHRPPQNSCSKVRQRNRINWHVISFVQFGYEIREIRWLVKSIFVDINSPQNRKWNFVLKHFVNSGNKNFVLIRYKSNPSSIGCLAMINPFRLKTSNNVKTESSFEKSTLRSTIPWARGGAQPANSINRSIDSISIKTSLSETRTPRLTQRKSLSSQKQ